MPFILWYNFLFTRNKSLLHSSGDVLIPCIIRVINTFNICLFILLFFIGQEIKIMLNVFKNYVFAKKKTLSKSFLIGYEKLFKCLLYRYIIM